MPVHVVQAGETVASIAAAAGFGDARAIWEHPDNAALRAQRADPNVLAPGDRLFLPERTPGDLSLATGVVHTFRLSGKPQTLRVRVLDMTGQPLAARAARFEIGESFVTTTDADGKAEATLPRIHPQEGQLRLPEVPRAVFHLKIGHLDPEKSVRGQRARLNNLGYFAGFVDDDDAADRNLRWALEEFACDHLDKKIAAKVEGALLDEVVAALVKAHGC